MLPRPVRCAPILSAAFILFAVALAPAAQAASSLTPVVHTITADGNVPRLAVNRTGDAIVVYSDNAAVSAAYVRRLSPDGVLGPEIRVSPLGERAITPRVAIAGDGRAFATWRAGPASPFAAKGRWIAADGTLGPVLTIAAAKDTGTTTDRDVTTIDTVVADDGRATVVFRNDDQSATDYLELSVRRVTPAGGLLPAAGPLVNVSLNSSVTAPVIAALPGGGTILAWRSSGVVATVVGATEVVPAALTPVSAGGLDADPSLVVDGTGRTTVAWRTGSGSYAVNARRLSTSGLPLAAMFEPSPAASGFVRTATPMATTAAGDTLFAWARQTGNNAVFTTRSSTATGALGAATTPLSDPAQNVGNYALAVDELGNGYAAWAPSATDPATAFLQPLSLTGVPSSPAQPLDTGAFTTVDGLGVGANGVGAVLLERSAAATPIVLRQVIPPPGGCADAGATTPAGTSVAVAVTCTGIQVQPAVASGPAHGTVAAGGGSVTYTPAAGFAGTDTFTVQGRNSAGVTGPTATVTVTVTPGATPVADRTAPVVSRVSLSHRRFRAGGPGAQASARRPARPAPAGTALRFTLSETATVRVTLERLRPGRRAGGRCVAATRRNAKAKRCTRSTSSGGLTRPGLGAGGQSVAFNGRRAGRPLPAGSYRATLRATDAAGNTSRPAAITFTIVPQ